MEVVVWRWNSAFRIFGRTPLWDKGLEEKEINFSWEMILCRCYSWHPDASNYVSLSWIEISTTDGAYGGVNIYIIIKTQARVIAQKINYGEREAKHAAKWQQNGCHERIKRAAQRLNEPSGNHELLKTDSSWKQLVLPIWQWEGCETSNIYFQFSPQVVLTWVMENDEKLKPECWLSFHGHLWIV